MSFKGKACSLIAGFLCLMCNLIFCQDQQIADSLVKVYRADTLTGDLKLELLNTLSFNEVNDLRLSLKYAQELVSMATKANSQTYQFHGYFQIGNKQRLMGNLDDAINAYFKSADVARKANFVSREGSAYGAIADIYAVSRNHTNAILYYRKAITMLRSSDDSVALASFILNAGEDFLNNKEYDSALVYFRTSGTLFEQVNYPAGKGYSLGNIGMLYANTGYRELAEKNMNAAIAILEKAEDYYPICVWLLSMCDIHLSKGDPATALRYATRSLQLAEKYKLKEQISNANLKLSELYEKSGKTQRSLSHYKNFIVYRDSLNDIKSVQKMGDLRTDFEVSQKQVEVDLLNQQRRNQRIIVLSLFIILGLTTVILGTLYWYYRTISKEKKKSESLLLNILPAETARELRTYGKVEAVKFEQVTVLFTDFVQFTKVAELTDPEQLVRSIDFYFKAFDEISTKYGLEKIKTVGDAYMCAGGLPTPNTIHAKSVAGAAKEIAEMVKNELHNDDQLCHFEVRIGVHTGPVVAGIVGIKKWQYDIWGDTVNIASRMESMSMPGRVNLSETTYQEVHDEFPCEYRGEIEVKNRGALKMYFLS